MLYIIGGASRSGKTTVAKRILEETKISYFSLDYLMMGIAEGAPELAVNPTEEDIKTAKRMWKIIDPLMRAMIENKIDYVIEGVQLVPSYLSKFEQDYLGKVKLCFIGKAEIDVQNSIDEIKFYSSKTENDRFEDFNHRETVSELIRIKTDSIRIREECEKYNLRYFDSSFSFNKIIDSILFYLKSY
ncbi:adenylate kinase [Bacillus subtilis]|uniref:Adenylate kinase n=1 Tax=Bacillus subtilis TaxID=1423 RepID=A0AC61YUX2_BACIU|nr:adenylate kinase [Bacillus subtilis]WEY98959.1 adenylate kinase [Bacillus subtilis]WGE06626.1 adenylate kinase [Bacillus subtilis]